jgi:hypothetical protein
MSHPRIRLPRLVSVHVLGATAKRLDQNDDRARLLNWIIDELCFREPVGSFDVLLLPAGFFRLEVALGPLDSAARAATINGSTIGFACRNAGERLARKSGAMLVVGVDTRRVAKDFSGDQFMAAWQGDRIVGSARKLFASSEDTSLDKKRPYLLFDRDADDPARIITLPSGGKAVLLVCYDAFVFSELARGPTSKRASMRWISDGSEGGRRTTARERDALLERFADLMRREKPGFAMIAIHGFRRPGRDILWQRHGIAGASAGLGGALAVGAAHFTEWLPDEFEPLHSTLSSSRVKHSHLKEGLHRTAHKAQAIFSRLIEVPGSPRLIALVRMFDNHPDSTD